LIGITGTVLVMIAHGLLAALTFGLSGYLRAHAGTLNMDELGGLLRKLPFIGTALVMAALAGCGLPGFANFAGEVTVLFGAWKANFPPRWLVMAAAWGALVIGAIYMLRAVRSILHGELSERFSDVQDASLWRRVPFALLLGGLLLFGCFPGLLVNKIKPSAETIVSLATGQPPKAPLRKAQTAQIKQP
jgi:NADH-quinone oxidoreductase subunit M